MNPTALFGGVDRELAFHEGQIRQLNQRRSPLELAHGLALVTGFGGGLFAAVAAAHRLLGDADQLVAIALRAGILTMLVAAGVAIITGRTLARIDRRVRPHAQRVHDLRLAARYDREPWVTADGKRWARDLTKYGYPCSFAPRVECIPSLVDVEEATR